MDDLRFIPASASSSPTWRVQRSAWSPSNNHRGTCEQYIKEGKGAVKWTRLLSGRSGAGGAASAGLAAASSASAAPRIAAQLIAAGAP
jgi:hypothetical protein